MLCPARKGYKSEEEERLHRTEREAKVVFAKSIDEEYKAKGRPESMEKQIIAAYAAIPQTRLWMAPHLRPDSSPQAASPEGVSNLAKHTTPFN